MTSRSVRVYMLTCGKVCANPKASATNDITGAAYRPRGDILVGMIAASFLAIVIAYIAIPKTRLAPAHGEHTTDDQPVLRRSDVVMVGLSWVHPDGERESHDDVEPLSMIRDRCQSA